MTEKQNGLSEKAEAAFQATAATVIERAKQTGTPVVVWEDGSIKEIPSDELDSAIVRSSPPPADRPLPKAD